MAYAANRHPGVRAAVAWSPEIARLAREHNDANVLVLPARFVSEDEGVEILKTGWPRHSRAGGTPPSGKNRPGARDELDHNASLRARPTPAVARLIDQELAGSSTASS